MDIRISPAPLTGSVRAIASKSGAHRLLICAALSDAPSKLYLPTSSQDIEATIGCLRALGADITRTGEYLTVVPIKTVPNDPFLDCCESGSTLRFLLPVAAAVAPKARFTGSGRLPDRPITELVTAMASHGVGFTDIKLPLEISGRLTPGNFSIPGNVSSQYITGLLLAMAALGVGSSLSLTTALESSGYVDITLHAMSKFGVEVESTPGRWVIPAGQRFTTPGTAAVDGDWSNAAFFLTSGALGKGITMTGLDLTSPQGDKQILNILRCFGANVDDSGDICVSAGELHGCEVDVGEIPDALPILAVLAANAKGGTQFINAGRLRLKESDRLSSTANLINSLGGKAQVMTDSLAVFGGGLTGGVVDGCNDHRIVMAAAIAASLCKEPVIITGAQAVKKSYPGFFDDFRALGGIAEEI